MSKGIEADEEWMDYDGEEEEEEEEDTTINNSDVVVRYKKAAVWCNETLQVLVDAAKPGVKVCDLCRLGDETIAKKLKSMFRGTEKGIAFPTCVSVNHCVAHNSPAPGDEAAPQRLRPGDVAHVDLGIHIDGYCAQLAHTLIIPDASEEKETGKEKEEGKEKEKEKEDERAARVIAAAQSIMDTAVRKLRPGVQIYDVTDVIEKASSHYGVTPVDGVLSHMVKRYIVDSVRCIPQRKVAEHLVHDYTIDAGQVWTLDIVVSSGKGKLRELDARPSVFKASLDSSYTMKMESARELQREIEAKYQTFPFALRNLETKKARLGLSEMIKHGAVAPFPVLYEREGEVVAHFKKTVLVSAKKIEPITGLKSQNTVELPPFTDEMLLATSKMSLSLVEKKKKA